MSTAQLLVRVLNLAMFIPAIILHEVSHGYVAYLLGDPTAKYSGRLTLNPIAHIDLWGTILLPMLMLVVSGGQFALGYAKPVPINPRLMHRVTYKNGMLLTGIAGPLMNVCLAIVAGVAFRVADVLSAPAVVLYMLGFFTFANLMLAFFNLIPIPPLDGSRVLQRFLPQGAWQLYHQLERYGFIIVLGILILAPNLFYGYLSFTAFPLSELLGGPHLLPAVFNFML